MSNYLAWNKETIDLEDSLIKQQKFNLGYLFTREAKGSMYQTRSLRINLAKFEANSENRRILSKVEGLKLESISLPININEYDWNIHKLGKEYYETKFGAGVFSANKIKELLTEGMNFNNLLKYSRNNELVGYAICHDDEIFRQYAYPFYNLEKFANNYGMGMMLLAILDAQQSGKQYIYLGSATRAADIYKLQFSGLEWFDGQNWQTDLDSLKTILQTP
jgi:arginyl-tRNA--protein-N-Asp/Glu arginylyltransferase